MKRLRNVWIVLILCFILAGCGAGDAAVSGQEEVRQADENGQEEALQEDEGGWESSDEDESVSERTKEAAEGAGKGARSVLDQAAEEITYIDVPVYTGDAYTVVNENIPYFSDDELTDVSFEYYAELDSLGRCGACMASVGQDIMPTEDRENIGSVKPTGWHTVKYEGIVDGNYLYNRCHLLGFQLTGENANEKNLITGTRYMNVEGMLPFENMVADYVKETGNHVMYRVTPLFDGDNLVADGVLMEAKSVEDGGADISFNVFCYNVQPGVLIDYATGESAPDEAAAVQESSDPAAQEPETRQKSDGQAQEQAESRQTQQQEENSQASQTQPEIQFGQQEEPKTPAALTGGGAYAVNGKNGKIHMTGKCPATGDSDKAMTEPIYFNTYEEAEERSVLIDSDLKDRKCGNCW